MRILLITAGKSPKELEIESGLESMQALVGGLIQVIYPFEESIALICNDEGKLQGLPYNRVLEDSTTGKPYDIVAGDFVLCYAPADMDDFMSLTDQQIEKYQKYFQHPQVFFRTEAGISVVEMEDHSI